MLYAEGKAVGATFGTLMHEIHSLIQPRVRRGGLVGGVEGGTFASARGESLGATLASLHPHTKEYNNGIYLFTN